MMGLAAVSTAHRQVTALNPLNIKNFKPQQAKRLIYTFC
jgi:hypothetical protein